MKNVALYTDGACSGNPGPGGWGFVLIYGNNRLEDCGFVEETTNNRMEIMAVLEGMKRLKEPCELTVYSDSTYVVNAFVQHWLKRWQQNGWITSQKKPVINQDLWVALLELIETRQHKMMWVKVPGHQDNENNNRCDELARGAIKNAKNEEKQK